MSRLTVSLSLYLPLARQTLCGRMKESLVRFYFRKSRETGETTRRFFRARDCDRPGTRCNLQGSLSDANVVEYLRDGDRRDKRGSVINLRVYTLVRILSRSSIHSSVNRCTRISIRCNANPRCTLGNDGPWNGRSSTIHCSSSVYVHALFTVYLNSLKKRRIADGTRNSDAEDDKSVECATFGRQKRLFPLSG